MCYQHASHKQKKPARGVSAKVLAREQLPVDLKTALEAATELAYGDYSYEEVSSKRRQQQEKQPGWKPAYNKQHPAPHAHSKSQGTHEDRLRYYRLHKMRNREDIVVELENELQVWQLCEIIKINSANRCHSCNILSV